MKMKLCSLIWAALAMLACAGCGEPAGEPTYSVTGTVTFNGQPLEGAVVSFLSASGKPAVGKTDASGKYSLTTDKKDDGAQAGHYQVTILKYDNPPPEADAESATEGPSNVDVTAADFSEYPADYNELEESEKAAVTATNVLPAKYADPSTSGLEADVAEGENVHDFKIEG